jgi:polyphosphate glucokinase
VTARFGLGIDVGGTGIKASVVDLSSGELVTKRVRVNTPKPATPEAVAEAIRAVVDTVALEHSVPADMPAGAGLPCVVKNGMTLTAANIDKKWIGAQADQIIGAALGRRVLVINDADAAAIAEARLGAGKDVPGTVLVLTIGTGIGSGMLVDGRLVPNTELGHLEFKGKDAETLLSGASRERRRLRWKTWATEFDQFLARVELYLSPDLIILGGGVSKVMDKYRQYLTARAPIVTAKYLNTSGIIGAALAAADAEDGRLDAVVGRPAAALVAAEASGPAPI